jgi:hypothetical protein
MNTSDPPSLCRYYLLSSIRTNCLDRRHKTHYLLDARCIAVRSLPHYLPNARFIALKIFPYYLLNARCIAMSLFHRRPLLARCIAMRRFHRHPLLARYVSVRRLPVGRLPVGRLPVLLRTLVLYAAFVVLKHSLCRSYCSGSDWYSRIFYHFLSLEHSRRWSVSFTRRHSHSGRSDVRGFPGCILLGVAASH